MTFSSDNRPARARAAFRPEVVGLFARRLIGEIHGGARVEELVEGRTAGASRFIRVLNGEVGEHDTSVLLQRMTDVGPTPRDGLVALWRPFADWNSPRPKPAAASRDPYEKPSVLSAKVVFNGRERRMPTDHSVTPYLRAATHGGGVYDNYKMITVYVGPRIWRWGSLDEIIVSAVRSPDQRAYLLSESLFIVLDDENHQNKLPDIEQAIRDKRVLQFTADCIRDYMQFYSWRFRLKQEKGQEPAPWEEPRVASLSRAEIIENLWAELDRGHAATGSYDLPWLISQLQVLATVPHFNRPMQWELTQYATVLQQISSDLNPDGTALTWPDRKQNPGGATTRTDIRMRLRARGLKMGAHPPRLKRTFSMEHPGRRAIPKVMRPFVAARRTEPLIKTAWDGADEVRVVQSRLYHAARRQTEPLIRGYLELYRAALRNISLDLNRKGPRLYSEDLVPNGDETLAMMAQRYTHDAETQLRARGWAVQEKMDYPSPWMRRLISGAGQ